MKNWEKIRHNKQLKEIQTKRSLIIDVIRNFFKKRGFLEMHTPILVKHPGMEPYLTPFKVDLSNENNKRFKGYLITSPEYSLKKMISSGFTKVFEITRAFRSHESFGGLHNPEFMILEWYRAKANYFKIMKDTEDLTIELNRKINHSNYLTYQNQRINLKKPWLKMTVKQVFKKYTGINLDKAKNIASFRKLAQDKGYRISKSDTWDDIFYQIFLNEIEPNLDKNRPIIIYQYPLPQAALAKRLNKKSFYAERFEVYIGGVELANAFSELTDPNEQLKRLKEEQKLRQKLHKERIEIDKDFIRALRLGLPPSGGIALGLDRLMMLLLNIKDINNLLPFPANDIFN